MTMQSTLVMDDERTPPFAWVLMAITLAAGLLLAAAAFASTSKTDAAIDPAFCNQLVKHTPSADVAYQPGVDVNGNKVAPADLPGQPQMALPQKLQIPLTLNLAKTLNLNTSAYPYTLLGQGTEANLGTLTVEGDKVMFNNQELSDAQQDKLAVLCLHPQ